MAADDVQLRPDEYILEGGHGSLSLKKNENGRISFSLYSRGANGHECGIDGEIQETLAHVAGIVEGRPCLIKFQPTSKGIAVSAESEGCQDFCGVRAGISGEYLTTTKDCTTDAVLKSRQKFKTLFDSKAFHQAKATLAPLISACEDTLNFIESTWMRNDLALTNYRLKDYNECMRILAPVADIAVEYEGVEATELRSDLQELLPVMKATLTNLKHCKKQLR